MGEEIVTRKELDKVWKHIEVANHNSTIMKTDLEICKNNISWLTDDIKEIKEEIDKFKWWLISGIIGSTALGFVFKMII